MNWLKTFLTPKRETAARPTPAPRETGSGTAPAVIEATRISTENIREWCNRLEREGQRVGNHRLIQQARNIRVRHGL